MLADARTYEHPCNHALVRIVPPAGTKIDDTKRPFIIIDPRAGHGPGIGGFKDDSQVGVVLREGHAVYFVIFFPEPEPGQTLADVTDAEAEFVRIVAERHPDSPKPSLIGNCQGMGCDVPAAARPDERTARDQRRADVVLGRQRRRQPDAHAGGLTGGAWICCSSDLGAGTFDGANLVANFENLNPANTLWDKHYHLYDEIDGERERYLEFERWWGILPLQRGGDPLDRQQPVVGNKPPPAKRPGRAATSISSRSAADRHSRRWATTSRRRSRRSTGRRPLRVDRGNQANGQTIVG
jgi:hypothetical protein